MAGRDTPEKLDDHNIIGGSPTDRVIGMLLERTEAMRELHESMREQFRDSSSTAAELKVMVGRLVERADLHDRSDTASFTAVNASIVSLGGEVKALAALVTQATTAGLIQKAQFTAGWKVITVIGGTFIAVMAIFLGFFNHGWK